MTTVTAAALTWSTGGPYPLEYRARTAGRFGCDPCRRCDQSPSGGETVWLNCYGDLYCDPCARRSAANYDARGGHQGDLDRYYAASEPAQCHGCGKWCRSVITLADQSAMCESCRIAEMHRD